MLIFFAILILVIILSATLHEVMHGFTSYWLGDDTARMQGRLTLNPIAHIDPFLSIALPLLLLFAGGPIVGGAKPVPYNPYRLKYGDWGQALVALAGPFTNLILAFVAGIWLRFVEVPDSLSFIIQLFVQVNLGFFIFNMLPLPPLDGSRLLYAFSSPRFKQVLRNMEKMSIWLVLGFVILFSGVISRIIISVITPLFEGITGQSFTQFLISLSNLLQ